MDTKIQLKSMTTKELYKLHEHYERLENRFNDAINDLNDIYKIEYISFRTASAIEDGRFSAYLNKHFIYRELCRRGAGGFIGAKFQADDPYEFSLWAFKYGVMKSSRWIQHKNKYTFYQEIPF